MIVGDNLFIENKILASAAIIEAAPVLRTLKSSVVQLRKECGTCGGAADAKRKLDTTWNDIRQALVGLSPDVKLLIRERASGGKPIRIAYRQGRGAETKIVSGEI